MSITARKSWLQLRHNDRTKELATASPQSQHERVGYSFATMTKEKSNEALLDTLQTDYSEVFDSAIHSRFIMHSIVASVKDSDEPVTTQGID